METQQKSALVAADANIGSNSYNINSAMPWGAIIAGVIVSFGIEILLNFLGISLGMIAFEADNSMGKMTVGVIIWLLISNIIALGSGGWFTGKFSNMTDKFKCACLGLITWSLTALIFIGLTSSTSGMAMGSLVQMPSNSYISSQIGSQSNITNKIKKSMQQIRYSESQDQMNNSNSSQLEKRTNNTGKLSIVAFIVFLAGAIACVAGTILGGKENYYSNFFGSSKKQNK